MPILEVGKTYETRNNFYQATPTQDVAWTEGPYYVEIVEQATSGTHPFKGVFRYSPSNLDIQGYKIPRAPLFIDSFNTLNSSLWRVSNNFSNDDIFNVGWLSSHVSFAPSTGLVLTLSNIPSSSKPYSAGEVKSKGYYSYGSYKTSFKGSSTIGVISTFGLKTNNGITDLITINLRGEYPTKVGFKILNEEILIDIGVNVTTNALTYEIRWSPNEVSLLVNDVVKYTKNTSTLITDISAYIVVNIWTSTTSSLVYTGLSIAYCTRVEYQPSGLALYGGNGIISTEDGYGLFYDPNGIYFTNGTFHDLDLIQEVDSDTLNKLEGKITNVAQSILEREYEDLFKVVYWYGINLNKQQLTEDDLLTLATLYKQAFDSPTYALFISKLQSLI